MPNYDAAGAHLLRRGDIVVIKAAWKISDHAAIFYQADPDDDGLVTLYHSHDGGTSALNLRLT